jgi:general secretion pathway protein D
LLLGAAAAPLAARTRKGDKLLAQGKDREARKDWDAALEFYEQALSQDPTDVAYQLAANRVRFQASQAHVDKGQTLRAQGSLAEAMLEFQKAYAINPSSTIAEQEIRITQDMIRREQRKAEQDPTAESTPEERGLTPAQAAKKAREEKLATLQPIPELRPLNPQPINLKMNNQQPRVLFETVGKLAGINVLFDPEYTSTRPQSIELTGATLEEALDYLGVITKSFWKPLSSNTIFVTNDNTTKRRDYEEQVMKVFYLSNVNTPQELQEIVTAVRSVADIQRLFVYNAQNAIIARGEADRIALAEKIISDLDKPKSEVVVDVLVMEVNSAVTRKLAAAIAPSGLNVPISFNPRSSIRVGAPAATGDDNGSGGNSGASTAIPLSNIGKISSADYSLVMPDALLQAVLTDSGTKVLQSPQLRSVDNQKAELKIGDRQPTATGSFQPGIGGVGINPLVNTQFTFIDVGVNVTLVPRVHENRDVSLHVEIDISKVTGLVDLGGIDQPIIGQRKVIHDIRMREGEINVLGGLTQQQNTRTVNGIPWLSSIPVLGRLFSSESVERSSSELLIALVPHIVRKPELNEQNLRGVAVGNATVVKLNYAPRRPEGAAAPAPAGGAATPPAAPLPGPAAPPATAPPVVAPPGGAAPPAAPPVTPQPPAATPPAAAAPAPAGAARVTFLPSQVDVQLGGSFSVNLMLDNGTEVFSAPMQIKFDPKILRLDDVTQGNLLSSDGQQVIFTKNILNDTGDATVNLSRFPGASGVTGSGVLVTLSFQAIARGSSTVAVPGFTVRNAQSQPVVSGTPQLAVTVR